MDIIEVKTLEGLELNIDKFNSSHMLFSYDYFKGFERYFFLSKVEFEKFIEGKLKYICVRDSYLKEIVIVEKDSYGKINMEVGDIQSEAQIISDPYINGVLNDCIDKRILCKEDVNSYNKSTLKKLVEENG